MLHHPSESKTYGYNQFELQSAVRHYMKPASSGESDKLQVRNLNLKQKMEALTWLSRSSNFVTGKLAREMIDAFRDTEVPIQDVA